MASAMAVSCSPAFVATEDALSRNSPTSCRRPASSAATVSVESISALMSSLSARTVRMALRVAASAGLARRMMAFTSAPRAANPAPSVFTASGRRRRTGTVQIWNRSEMFTGIRVRSMGSVGTPSVSGSGLPAGVPGSHCTKFSPIRPSGWIAHVASDLKPEKRGSMLSSRRAR